MKTKEQFKQFVKENPNLLKHVKKGKTSWQNLYEIYDLYGDNKEAWKQYLTEEVAIGSFDLLGFLKQIDLDKIEESINSVQRVIGLLQDMGNKTEQTQVKPRPIYKHFED